MEDLIYVGILLSLVQQESLIYYFFNPIAFQIISKTPSLNYSASRIKLSAFKLDSNIHFGLAIITLYPNVKGIKVRLWWRTSLLVITQNTKDILISLGLLAIWPKTVICCQFLAVKHLKMGKISNGVLNSFYFYMPVFKMFCWKNTVNLR